jgi:hypothetical protein
VTRSVVDLALALARTTSGLVDPELRVAYVREAIREIPPDALSDLLLVVTDGARARRANHPELMLALSVALCEPDCEELRRAAAQAAVVRGQIEVARLLQRAEARPDEEGLRATRPPPESDPSRPLTLGERKSLARRNDRQLIARAIRDPHPDVIRILLGNPALTEDDVVRLCARRPAVPEIQREVFRTSRWLVRYRVKRALALNPSTPLDVSLPLVHHLTGQDARLLRSSPELPDALRVAALGTDTDTRH